MDTGRAVTVEGQKVALWWPHIITSICM
jgi:hypothetical protein